MLILPQTIQFKVCTKDYFYIKEKFNNNIKLYDIVEIDIIEFIKLYPKSAKKINVICDQCNMKFTTRINLVNVNYTLCSKCKSKQTFLKKYGVENPYQSEIVKEKIKQTNLEKYGVNHAMKLNKIQNKVKKTCLDKYGVENVSQSEIVKEKIKQINLEKYGVENPYQSEIVKEKIKQTNLEKYGVEYACQSEIIKEKTKKACLDKYGVENPYQSEIVKEKIKQTNLKKYGVENVFQSKEIQNKMKQTNLKKYGVEYVLQNHKVQEKIKQTNLKKYGVEYLLNSNIIRDKIKQTNLEKYGVENPMQNTEIYKKARKNAIKTMYRNNSGPCSQQQQYICNLYNTEPNYPIGECQLDIAFPEEMIYIEYDGGGHGWWNLTNGKEKQFKQREMKRNKFLQSKGWKLIRIISKKDLLPCDEIILNLIQECKDYLKNNHNWIEINIDNSEIRSSKLNKKIDLGTLRKIKLND